MPSWAALASIHLVPNSSAPRNWQPPQSLPHIHRRALTRWVRTRRCEPAGGKRHGRRMIKGQGGIAAAACLQRRPARLNSLSRQGLPWAARSRRRRRWGQPGSRKGSALHSSPQSTARAHTRGEEGGFSTAWDGGSTHACCWHVPARPAGWAANVQLHCCSPQHHEAPTEQRQSPTCTQHVRRQSRATHVGGGEHVTVADEHACGRNSGGREGGQWAAGSGGSSRSSRSSCGRRGELTQTERRPAAGPGRAAPPQKWLEVEASRSETIQGYLRRSAAHRGAAEARERT